MTHRTTADVIYPANYEGRGDPQFTVPAGTEVIQPKGTQAWAVKSTKLLIELTGNQHDPIYRYYWVPANVVEEVPNEQS